MDTNKIAVIGLGYVGLPVSMVFAQKYKVIGFDTSHLRIDELNREQDHTNEATPQQLKTLKEKYDLPVEQGGIRFTNDVGELFGCNIFIITVPTPVDEFRQPDLSFLRNATNTVSGFLKKGDIVIYESTVYPGCTEEVAVPILESVSGLIFNIDFFCGYSPERINPGDRDKTIENIMKITSGSTPETADVVDRLYRSVITAGTYKAPSIKVAEAAKVIENTQRDINIAFMNELGKIFHLLGIDTQEVLRAAGTKWNFLSFQPGLVGGHCIGVDPYYLVERARVAGYTPELIVAARKINDSMGSYVFGRLKELMLQKNIPVSGADVLVMGFTFKADFPDVRNTRVINIVNELLALGADVTLFDPYTDPDIVYSIYGVTVHVELPVSKRYDAIVVAVDHKQFSSVNYEELLQEHGVLFDVKGILDISRSSGRL